MWQECDGCAVSVGGRGAESDKGAHVGASLLQGRPGGLVERPADPELNRCGKGQKNNGLSQPDRCPGKQPGHRAEHDRKGESQADQKFGAEVANVCGPSQAFEVHRVIRVDREDSVADFLDLTADCLAVQGSRIEMHGGLFGGEIDLRLPHTDKTLQGVLDAPGTGGAVHASDRQIQTLRCHAVSLS